MVGSEIGHYRIVRLLGKGGMGEVYLADDTKLGRQVAVKILDAAVAADPDRRERFTREARAAAALNHPNIVTIHSVEEAGGHAFLTLEYIEGRTLAEILPAGGMPLDRLLPIGISLADAVGAAHQRGITHRDLKPANVMLTADGRVKVLDFGLAKLREEVQPMAEGALPTQALTGEGRILGTVAYMSPEQAEGRAVDQRSDVFSLGVMLYEMAVGDRPFKGETQVSVLSSILRDNPPSVSDLKRELPRDLGRIIRRCLAKDPEDRYQTAKDLRNDLRGLRDELASGDHSGLVASSSSVAVSAPDSASLPARPAAGRKIGPGLMTVAAAAGIILLAAGWLLTRPDSSTTPPDASSAGQSRPFSSLALTRLTTTGTAGLAVISADARYVAHVVTGERGSALWLRQVATSSNVEIVPPAQGRFAGLAFSPDNNYVLYVFYPAATNFASLFQVPVLGGGSRQLLYDLDTAPAFSPDGKRFAFVRGVSNQESVLMVADADGQNVRQLAAPKAPRAFATQLQTASWSPDGRVIAVASIDSSVLAAGIVLVDAESGQERPLGGSTWRAVRSLAWVPDGSGLLVNAQEAGGESTIAQLWEVSYPAGAVRQVTTDLSSYAGVSLSRDGRTLVTVRGEQRSSIWVSRDGSGESLRAITSSAGADDGLTGVAWAADGRLLYTSTASGNSDIWIMNADGTGRVQLTTDRADDRNPVATADGRYVVFLSERGSTRGIWRMDPGGNNQTRLGTDTPSGSQWPPFVSPDGRWVTFTNDRQAHLKIPIDGGASTSMFELPAGQTLPELPLNFHDPVLSPDGRMAMGHYSDPKAGREGTAIMPVDQPGQFKLFPNVFVSAQWTADGRGLLYMDRRNGNIWRQPVAAGAPVQITKFDNEQMYRFAYSSDGKQLALSRGSTISDVVLMTSRDEPPQGR
jgi:serine/threonine protein kinase/Tol biopolymer transport system component